MVGRRPGPRFWSSITFLKIFCPKRFRPIWSFSKGLTSLVEVNQAIKAWSSTIESLSAVRIPGKKLLPNQELPLAVSACCPPDCCLPDRCRPACCPPLCCPSACCLIPQGCPPSNSQSPNLEVIRITRGIEENFRADHLVPLPNQEECAPRFSFRKLPKTGQLLYCPESEVCIKRNQTLPYQCQ